MVSKKLHTLLNEQIGNELGAELQYLAMACWADRENFPGIAGWFRSQASEEHEHAMKILGWMQEWDLDVSITGTSAPTTSFDGLESVFDDALGHEQQVTAQINEIYAMSGSESAWPVQVAFQWFVSEQVEEEVNARDNLARIRQVGDNPAAMLSFDRHLAR